MFSEPQIFVFEDRFIGLDFNLDKRGNTTAFRLDDAEARVKFTNVKIRENSD